MTMYGSIFTKFEHKVDFQNHLFGWILRIGFFNY